MRCHHTYGTRLVAEKVSARTLLSQVTQGASHNYVFSESWLSPRLRTPVFLREREHARSTSDMIDSSKFCGDTLANHDHPLRGCGIALRRVEAQRTLITQLLVTRVGATPLACPEPWLGRGHGLQVTSAII